MGIPIVRSSISAGTLVGVDLHVIPLDELPYSFRRMNRAGLRPQVKLCPGWSNRPCAQEKNINVILNSREVSHHNQKFVIEHIFLRARWVWNECRRKAKVLVAYLVRDGLYRYRSHKMVYTGNRRFPVLSKAWTEVQGI